MQKNSLNYPVDIVNDAFGLDDTLAEHLKGARILLLAENNLIHRTEGIGTRIGRYLHDHGLTLAAKPLILPGGEKVKSDELASERHVMTAIVKSKMTPNDAVLAIGGGAMLDVASYAIAQIRCPVRYVRMPTTPSAMLGAAYSEYAKIYWQGVKDVLALRCTPTAVVVDPTLATTVLDGVWRGGFGEAMRQAVLSKDAALLKVLAAETENYRDRKVESLAKVINATVSSLKKKGCEATLDDFIRALEVRSEFKLPYGYAVGIATYLAVQYGLATGKMKAKEGAVISDTLMGTGALEALRHSLHIIQQPAAVFSSFNTIDGGEPDAILFEQVCKRISSEVQSKIPPKKKAAESTGDAAEQTSAASAE